MCVVYLQTDSFVMSMCYGDGQLWWGDKLGGLHVMNTIDSIFDEQTIQVQ